MIFRRDILLIIFSFVWMNENSDASWKELPAATLKKFPHQVPKVIKDPFDRLVFRNKCLADLGCFYTGPPFHHPQYRPISLSPFDLKDMKTKFWLFTPSTPSDNVVGTLIAPDAKSLEKSGFEKNLPLKFLIHGYLVDLKDKEHDDRYVLKNALLKEGAYNVIIVDWTASNRSPYPQAVANARVVGAQVAQLIHFLQKEAGVDPKNTHIIGHSLGAHVSGFAGERITNLGRISGLDPAGPYFRYGDNAICLDETDADFLDVIHTDTGSNAIKGLGIREAIGDLDFYPNGGHHQPSCKVTLVNTTVGGINFEAISVEKGFFGVLATSCNHNRAWKYYIATVDPSKCTFMGTQCEDYAKFQKGECKNGKTAEMGFHAKKDPNLPKKMKYYLNTGSEFPFCI